MENCNKDELVPPSWMNKEFFEEVLQTATNANFSKIVDYKITPATGKGDHYASIMFRSIIQYLATDNTKKEISLIIKTSPESEGTKKEMLKESKIFETEIRMFDEIIPKFEKMLEGIGDKTVLGAKMFYSSLKPRKVIVLEDITKYGFTTVGQRLANYEESKLALNKLAKWHACSYLVSKENKGYVETFTEGLFNMPGIAAKDLFTKGVYNVIELAQITPQLKKFIPKLEKLKDKLFARCLKINEFCKSKAKLNLLTHGDFHAKNLMFRYAEKGVAEDVILVDFQMSFYGSMAFDLIYCYYMMLDSETRAKHKGELTYHFFQTFIETLKRLGYKGKLPLYSDLLDDLYHLGFLDLYIASSFLPFMNAFVGDPDMDPDEVMNSTNKMLGLYKSKLYIQDIENLLTEFLYKGFLDGYDDGDV